MMFSTRGRYALRVLIDLAEHGDGSYIPMKDVASRQDISLKYLERILPDLTKAHLIDGQHGKGGGYRLTKAPEEYRVSDVLTVTEGDFAPVACLTCDASPCARASECRTLPMWTELNKRIHDYLDSVTIADLMNTNQVDNYII